MGIECLPFYPHFFGQTINAHLIVAVTGQEPIHSGEDQLFDVIDLPRLHIVELQQLVLVRAIQLVQFGNNLRVEMIDGRSAPGL